MWKSQAGHSVNVQQNQDDDDWETDPDFVNDVTEQEQRWGSKTVEGSGRQEALDLKQLRSNVKQEDVKVKEGFQHVSQKDAAKGFGGKYGVQTDRKDKSAQGWDYHEKLQQHQSQTDATKGFGGKFGVQKDRVDKSAKGWDYHEKLQQHESQTDATKGFGGKYGVQKDRVDKVCSELKIECDEAIT
jgi:cortactin